MEERKLKVAYSDYLSTDLKYEEEIYEKENIDFHYFQLRDASEEEALKCLGDADMLMVNMFPCTRSFISKLTRCKFIMRHGVGYDSVDVDACTEHGILLVNIPDANAVVVAEHTLGLLLNCARKFMLFNTSMREGRWEWKMTKPLFQVMHKTLGIFGCGRIGSRLTKIMKGFEMNVLVYDPYIPVEKTEKELGVKMTDFETLLKESDFLTIHAPMTDETHHIFGAEQLKMMKSTAFLINAARGPIVDQNALIKALEEKWIAGAALDVFEQEPLEYNSELRKLENVVFTPHIAGYNEETIWAMRKRIVDDILRFRNGEKPLSIVNPQVWDSQQK